MSRFSVFIRSRLFHPGNKIHYYMASHATGQDKATLVAWDCPFGARDNISLRPKQEDESFLWHNIFRDSKKKFSDFSVGMKLETRKPNASSLLPSLFHVTTILVVECFLSSVCNGCHYHLSLIANSSSRISENVNWASKHAASFLG